MEEGHKVENIGSQVDWEAIANLDNVDDSGNRPDETPEEKIEDKEPETPVDDKGDESGSATDKSKETVEEQPKTEITSFDINKYLAENSEGLFKSEDDFKNSITKVKEYDTLKQTLEQVQVEKENLFANPFMKTLNELHKANATKEQIDEFTNLYHMGDVTKIDPKEALVQDLIKKGSSRVHAERLIERKYNLDLSVDAEVLPAEEVEKNKLSLELSNEEMRLDAQPIIKQFKETFDSIMQPKSAELIQLEKIAAEKAYVEALREPAKKLADSIPEKFKVGELEFARKEDFKKEVESDFIDYFKDRKVDNESVKEFYEIQEAMFLQENFTSIKDAIEKDAYARAKKEVQAEYENNSGLPRENGNTMTDSAKQEFDNFLSEISVE